MAEVNAAELAMLTQSMNDNQKMLFMTQFNSAKKDRGVALCLSILLGGLGVDRFYVGDVGLGALKLLTLAGCGIWGIIDWFLIMGRTDDVNRKKAQEIAMTIKATS
jgi:TM2 domain-containing membrane protein YozV